MSGLTGIERNSVIELPVAAKEALAPNHTFFIIRPISLDELAGLFREKDIHRARDFTALTPKQAFEIAIPGGRRAVDTPIRKASVLALVDLAEIEEANKRYAERLHIAGIKSVTGIASLYIQADAQNILEGRGSLLQNIYAGTADQTENQYTVVGIGRANAGGSLWVEVNHPLQLNRLFKAVPVVVSEQVEI